MIPSKSQQHEEAEELEIEKAYALSDAAGKLRRLADALEQEKTFTIQIAGERIHVPPYATIHFEYERKGADEELEIEMRWTRS